MPDPDDVGSVAFSPDGKRVVSGSRDRTVRVWDAETGQAIAALQGAQDRISSVAYSPDGKRILSGSRDETLRMWDAASGALLGTLDGYYTAVYSPDGSRIAAIGSDLQILDASTRAVLWSRQPGRGNFDRVAFSPTGDRIVTGSTSGSSESAHTIEVWDPESDRRLAAWSTVVTRATWSSAPTGRGSSPPTAPPMSL